MKPPKLLALIVSAFVLFPTESSFAQSPGSWQILEPLASPRQEVGVAALEGMIYVIGGFDTRGQSVNTVERYDPETDQWESVDDLPSPDPLNHAGVAVVDGRLFVVGGLRQRFSAVDTLFRYDPATEQWSEAAPLPAARGAMGVAVLGGLIYVAGGLPALRSADFASYDPKTDQWTELPSMPTPRDHLAAVAVDGKFYAIAGRDSFPSGLLGANEQYDPATGQWRSRAAIPTPRAGIAAAVVQGLVYVFGGEGNADLASGVFDEVQQYDPSVDRWRQLLPMPTPRHGIGAAVIEGRIHIPGGATMQGFGVSGHHDSFLPPRLNGSSDVRHPWGSYN